MVFPILGAALVGAAARRGAKAEVVDAERRRQENQNPSAVIYVEPSAVSVVISTERKKAIDRLLRQTKYNILSQLREYIVSQQMNMDFYTLFQQEDGVITFLEQHPVIKKRFWSQVKLCLS